MAEQSLPALASTVGEGAPAKGLEKGAFYIQQTAGKDVALWRGKGAGEEPELVADLSGTPANGSVTEAQVAPANIDGAAAVPSMRTIDTDPLMAANSNTRLVSQRVARLNRAYAPARPTSGRFLLPAHSGLASAALGTVNTMILFGFPVVEKTEFDRIACGNITVKGKGAGLVMRMGVYADDGSQLKPTGAALFDAGTISATETGARAIEIAKTLEPGWYHGALVLQGTLEEAPTFITGNYIGAAGLGALDMTSAYRGLQQAGVTGALPEIGTLEPSKLSSVLFGLRVK